MTNTDTDRPDFYVLTPNDWAQFVRPELPAYISSGEVRLDQQNVPIWVNELKENGNNEDMVPLLLPQPYSLRSASEGVILAANLAGQ